MRGRGLSLGLLAAVALLLSSCGSGFYARRINRDIDKLKDRGIDWQVDTTWTDVDFHFPGVRNEVSFTFPKQESSVYVVTKDSIRLKLIRVTQPVDSAAILEKYRAEIECPPVDTTASVPTVIEKKIEVHSGIRWWWLIIAAAAGALIGIFKR